MLFVQLKIDDTTLLFILTRSTILHPLSWSSSLSSSTLSEKRLIHCEIYLPICIFLCFLTARCECYESKTKRKQKEKLLFRMHKPRQEKSELWMELIDSHNGKITAQKSNCCCCEITILPSPKLQTCELGNLCLISNVIAALKLNHLNVDYAKLFLINYDDFVLA